MLHGLNEEINTRSDWSEVCCLQNSGAQNQDEPRVFLLKQWLILLNPCLGKWFDALVDSLNFLEGRPRGGSCHWRWLSFPQSPSVHFEKDAAASLCTYLIFVWICAFICFCACVCACVRMCTYIYLFIYLSIYLSVCLSMSISISISIYIYIYIYLSLFI
jgi:hypothetical protein